MTKRFNEVTAVSDFTARIEPGAVTAFLGPNGAGKTTTLRMLLGQVRPTSGVATIGGAAYADIRQPLRVIGSVLEETSYRPRRTANRQLTIAAKANDIPLSRVGEVLSLVGLENEGDSRIGGFSLGMRQRLSVAHALLGDPGALVFDEPANGLDPEGIRWMRLLMRRLADEGRTVLVSSHVLSEVEQVADNVLVLSKGHLVLASGIEELADPSAGAVVVDAADRAALTTALAQAGFDIEILRSGLTVRGSDARRVGEVAADAGIALTTLVQRGPTLEDVFIQLTRGGKLERRAEAVTSQLVSPASSAMPAAPGSETAAPDTTTPDEPTPDASAAIVASAIASDVAAAAPGGPVSAAVVAAGAGTAIAHDGDVPVGEHEHEHEHGAESSDADATHAPSPVDDTTDAPSPADGTTDVSTAGADAASATPESTDSADPESTDSSDADAPSLETQQPVDDSTQADAPSFDDILFGTSADAETPSSFPQAEGNADHDGRDDHEATGIEVFEGLDAPQEPHASDSDDASDSGEASDSGNASDSDANAEEPDPRSEAVSSMLADAARAYFEDEPKNYPLGQSENADAGDDDRTRVIEVIDAGAGEHNDTEHDNGEHNDTEHADGEHRDGEHSHG